MPGPFYFAWAGGTITEQITLVTNGTTHGALPELHTLVGDVGNHQIINLASTEGLTVSGFYQVSGSHLGSGNYFLFDNTVLSGLPGSINLGLPTTGGATNTQILATKADNLGAAVATLSEGSSSVSISLGLPAGVYSIFGPGIGETDIPIGSTEGVISVGGGGVVILGAALLQYDGVGSGSLFVMAASPHTRTDYDEFGQAFASTTYTVASQGVRAFQSGTVGLGIAGFVPRYPRLIDHIPDGVLAGLPADYLYNITGPGLQAGTTFANPGSGNVINLDQPATDSAVGAILTISGPRTPDAPFDASVHNRFDEDVLSVEISHEEGGFATLTIGLKNPNIGLLALGRNLWCWLSWDQNWPSGTPDLVPLFNGRLIGVPKLQASEVVQLEFLARPDDLNFQKTALWENLAVLPYYDPLWFPTQPTADAVLETYSALWHIDRTSLAVTASDILEGEAGTIEIGEDQAFYDAFSLSYGQPPLVATTVSGTVTWQQQAEGSIDITQNIVSAFNAAGSAYRYTFPRNVWMVGGGGLIETLSGDGLKSDWPKAGTVIGGGWNLSAKNDSSGKPLCYIVDALRPAGGWMTPSYYRVTYAGQAPMELATSSSVAQTNLAVMTNPYGNFTIDFPINVYKVSMVLEYRANRKRTETVTAVMAAGVQRELSDSSESDRETVSFSSEFADKAVDPDGALPIGFVAYKSYFQTARGNLSLQYLLLAARAKLRARARGVDVTFGTSWANALGITLRHNVQLSDRRLPGGVCVGKVKSLRLIAGEEGMYGEFTIGCSIGTNISTDPAAGNPTYVDAFYVDNGYQVIAGQQLPIAALNDFYYQSLDDFVVEDDGLDFSNLGAGHVVNECRVTNGMSIQFPRLAQFQRTVVPSHGDPRSAMRSMTTRVTLAMQPVAGSEFTTNFYPAITELFLPMTINLGGTVESTWDSSAGIWDTGDSLWDHMAPLP